MGFDTEYEGQFRVRPTLRDEHRRYLATFAVMRHQRYSRGP